METVLQIEQATKRYKQQYALKDVSLTIKKGDIYGLIGKNGAGKTTLLKMITGLINIDQGQVMLFGSQNQREWIHNLRRTGSVIETPVAYEQLTAAQNLAYYCKLRGLVNSDKMIAESLKRVGLEDAAEKKFKNLSLGMKQKLGIAIAILTQPDLLILDEPINGLDPIAIVEFRQLIQRLNQEFGMTIIISSHILTELYHVATRFGFIDQGVLVKDITKKDFDQFSEDYIVLETPQLAVASQILKETLTYSFKAVNDNTLHIFGQSHQVNEILKTLVTEDVVIGGIYYSKQDLEHYFTDLVSETKEEI